MLPASLQRIDFGIVDGLSSYVVNHQWASVAAFVGAEILIVVPFLTLLALWNNPNRFTRSKPARKAVIMAVMALTVALALKSLLAFFISRDRPFLSHEDMVYLPLRVDSASFPSGHTILSFTIALSLIFSKLRRTGKVLLAVAIAVAFSRVAAGVHYPTDILGGIVVALVSVWLVHREASGIKSYLPNE